MTFEQQRQDYVDALESADDRTASRPWTPCTALEAVRWFPQTTAHSGNLAVASGQHRDVVDPASARRLAVAAENIGCAV